jgi:hypothetical protein
MQHFGYIKNEINWVGHKAFFNMDRNINGNREFVSRQLENKELKELLGIQPVEISLETRLRNDFYKHNNPIVLDGAIIQTRKHKRGAKRSKKSKRGTRKR